MFHCQFDLFLAQSDERENRCDIRQMFLECFEIDNCRTKRIGDIKYEDEMENGE